MTLDRAVNQEMHLCKLAEEQRKQVDVRQLYNQVPRQFESAGDKMPKWEPAADIGLLALSDPWLSNTAKMRKKCCYGREKNLGQYSSLSLSPAHLSHTKNITLSKIKCQRSYFYHHHHHVVPLAWIFLTLSRHFSLSFIASGRSSGLHPLSSHSCCMYVRASRPAFSRPYVGVHRSTSLMS